MALPSRVLAPIQPGATHSPTPSPTRNKNIPSCDSATPVPDSTSTATLTRTDADDLTLFYNDTLAAPRLSEFDLTACASTPSGLGIDLPLPAKDSLSELPIPLALAQIPEIPDWFDSDHAEPVPVPKSSLPLPPHLCATPKYDTPQSDYQSLEDYHPDALCCEDVLRELEETAEQAHSHNLSQSSKISGVVAFGFPSPGFATIAGKHPVNSPEIGTRTLIPHRPKRRSYSLDSADRRPIQAHPRAGLGVGLRSPFCLSLFQPQLDLDLSPPLVGSDEIDDMLHELHAHPDCLASPEIVYSGDAGPSIDRRAALAVSRAPAPTPGSPAPYPHLSAFDSREDDEWDDVDLRSASIPFPSSASLYAFPSSASWPAARSQPQSRARNQIGAGDNAHQKQKTAERMWTLEEQITIALLAAREKRESSHGRGSGRLLSSSGPSRASSRIERARGRLQRLFGLLWRRGYGGDGDESDASEE